MKNRSELTARGFVLGAAITLVFTAANVYLGLKVGLTFASSIPAAVISMAVLRAFRNVTIYENNIVQTIASAAGTLSSIIFVLPGLVMIGWWSGFPFLQSFAICAIGGVLGVMYSVPLRRALVTGSDLPYPEGVAAAEVLKVGMSAGSPERNRAGLLALVAGTVASAAFAAIVATRIFASEVAGYFRFGAATTGAGFSLSLALVGAGQLIGLTVGIAIFTGLFIAWGIATPILTAMHPAAGAAADVATAVWSHQVRFIGAGAIGVAALWSLGRLVRPVAFGVTFGTRSLAQPAKDRSGTAANRARLAHWHRRCGEPHLPRTAGGALLVVSLGQRARVARAGDDDRRGSLRRRRGFLRRGGLRLYGRAYRILEQPRLGIGNSLGDRCRAHRACNRKRNRARRGAADDRVRARRNGRAALRCNDIER